MAIRIDDPVQKARRQQPRVFNIERKTMKSALEIPLVIALLV